MVFSQSSPWILLTLNLHQATTILLADLESTLIDNITLAADNMNADFIILILHDDNPN
jgi:hypothetical protein